MRKNTSTRKDTNTRKNTNTHKDNSKAKIQDFLQEITIHFLQILNSTKLFHWRTSSYAVHKATDEFYTKLNENIDSFIEILLGKTNTRIHLMQKVLPLNVVKTTSEFTNILIKFKSYLVGLTENPTMNSMKNTDLFSIRDTILGDVNQLLYLLTFQ